jgi:uncharacterized ion transporter superfamily protein YfcC
VPSKSRFPHSLVLIFAMIVLAQLATYVLTPGEFQRVPEPGSGKLMVVPGTYAAVAADGVPWHAFLTLIPKGLEKGADIIFFVFVVGGVIGVVRASGAIDALIGAAIQHLGHRPALLVAGITTLLAVGASTIGMSEEYMPFVPVLVTMCLALKMDAIVAVGIVYIGAGVGYGCAALNPFTVMIAQRIAGVELASDQVVRWALLAVCLAISVHHTMRYVARIKADPSKSLVAGVDYSSGFEMPKDQQFTAGRALILALFAAAIAVFVWGIRAHDWYLTELAAVFFGIALLSALIARMSPNKVAREFCAGAAEMTTTALLIGFARTIELMLNEGRVIDTVIHGLAQPLQQGTPDLAAIGMLAVQSITNFFIPSGSGQAYVTMPIMAPLADITGVSREVAVLAYQFGDGFTNMIVPTNALLMGMLALGRIPFERWARFIVPLLAKIYVVLVVFLVWAVRSGF